MLRRSLDIVATVVTAAAPLTMGEQELNIVEETNKAHNRITFFIIKIRPN